MEKELIEKHDELLASMPETGEHDEASCPICIFKSEDNLPDERGEMETFTVEQLDAAVEAATSPLREEIASLKTAATEGEIASQVESVRSELTERISELEAERDLADAKTAAAEAALAEMVAFLEATAAEAGRIPGSVPRSGASRSRRRLGNPSRPGPAVRRTADGRRRPRRRAPPRSV